MFYRDCSSHINRRSTYCWINLNNLQWKFRLRLHLSCQFNKPAALAKYPRAAAGFAKNLAPLWRTSEAAGYYVAKCWSLNNSRACQCDRFGYAINYFFPLYLSGGHYKYDVYPVGNRFCVAASEEKRSSSAAALFPLCISSSLAWFRGAAFCAASSERVFDQRRLWRKPVAKKSQLCLI